MADQAKSTKEVTREYFDSMMLEMRLIDSAVPDTELELYGEKFQTPIMTAALSHLGNFHPDMPGSMVQYAAGARTIRIIKPYAEEEKIYDMIRCAEKCGALAVGMDIDHMFDLKGNPDICMGEPMAVKSSAGKVSHHGSWK